jgi:uncharacterized protein YdeI (YjbR/CyaY-like superfamily)
MNPKVDAYLQRIETWHEEAKKLRSIILGCGLTEELKWGVPCYTFNNHNIVLIHGFKEYYAILFVKGSLLKDANNILVQQTENVQAARHLRFTGLTEITALEPIIKSYIYEAIEVEKAGLKVPFKKTSEFAMPQEFEQKLNENAGLKTAFETLTPGRQRAYLLYFSSAKQAKTREARIEKYIGQILEGKGLDD